MKPTFRFIALLLSFALAAPNPAGACPEPFDSVRPEPSRRTNVAQDGLSRRALREEATAQKNEKVLAGLEAALAAVPPAAGLEEHAYPPPVVDVLDEKYSFETHRTYLNRHLLQWEWLRQNVVPELIERARRRGELIIRVLIPGAGTGDQLPATFHELAQILETTPEGMATDPEDATRWQIRVDGLERDKKAFKWGRQRLEKEAPFVWSRVAGWFSSDSQAYAQTVIKTLNRYHQATWKNLQLHEGTFGDPDVARRFANADLVILNFMLYQSGPEKIPAMLDHLDSSWPNAFLALNEEQAQYLLDHAVHHVLIRKELLAKGPDSYKRAYYFGWPKSAAGLEEDPAQPPRQAISRRDFFKIGGATAAGSVMMPVGVDPEKWSKAAVAVGKLIGIYEDYLSSRDPGSFSPARPGWLSGIPGRIRELAQARQQVAEAISGFPPEATASLRQQILGAETAFRQEAAVQAGSTKSEKSERMIALGAQIVLDDPDSVGLWETMVNFTTNVLWRNDMMIDADPGFHRQEIERAKQRGLSGEGYLRDAFERFVAPILSNSVRKARERLGQLGVPTEYWPSFEQPVADYWGKVKAAVEKRTGVSSAGGYVVDLERNGEWRYGKYMEEQVKQQLRRQYGDPAVDKALGQNPWRVDVSGPHDSFEKAAERYRERLEEHVKRIHQRILKEEAEQERNRPEELERRSKRLQLPEPPVTDYRRFNTMPELARQLGRAAHDGAVDLQIRTSSKGRPYLLIWKQFTTQRRINHLRPTDVARLRKAGWSNRGYPWTTYRIAIPVQARETDIAEFLTRNNWWKRPPVPPERHVVEVYDLYSLVPVALPPVNPVPSPAAGLEGLTQAIRQMMSFPESEKVTLVVNAPFTKSYRAVLGFLNSGRGNIVALKGLAGVFDEFYFDGHPKAVSVPEEKLKEVGIELPESGILDPSEWPDWDREARLNDLKPRILALRDTLSLPRAEVAEFEREKFSTLGDRKKLTLTSGTTIYANSHPHDLVVIDKKGIRRTIRTLRNSPVISDQVQIVSVGPETIRTWKEILADSKGVIVLGDTAPFAEILSEAPTGQQRVVVNPADDQQMAMVANPGIWKVSSAAGLEATHAGTMEEKMVVSLRRYHQEKLRGVEPKLFEEYLAEALAQHQEDLAGFWMEVSPTLQKAVAFVDDPAALKSFLEKAREKLGEPDRVLAEDVEPQEVTREKEKHTNPKPKRAAGSKARIQANPRAIELVPELEGSVALRRGLTSGQVGQYLLEHPRVGFFYAPELFSSPWRLNPVDLQGSSRAKKIEEAVGGLIPSQHYALYGKGETTVLAIPEAVFLKETPRKVVDRFRGLARKAVEGSDTAKLLEGLLRRFGASLAGKKEGVDVRIPKDSAHLYLFPMVNPDGKNRTVLLSFPMRFRNQVVRLVPRGGEDSRLVLDIYQLEPKIFLRQVRWNEVSGGFVRVGSTRQERLRQIPELAPLQLPEIEEEKDYPAQEIPTLTGISGGITQDLETRGYLYCAPTGHLPGRLVSLMANTNRQINRPEYPVSALQDFLGMEKQDVQHWISKAKPPLIQRPGQFRRLSRETVLEMVLTRRIERWVSAQVEGFVTWPQAGRALGVPFPTLQAWPGDPPFYSGVPLWVQFDGRRYLTHKGFEGLQGAVGQFHRLSVRTGEVFLLDEVKTRHSDAAPAALGNRYLAAFRAVQELGIPYRVLKDHPLALVREFIVVPQKALLRIFREAEHPTAWKTKQIQPNRRYGTIAVARVLGATPSTVSAWLRTGKLPSSVVLGRRWVLGKEVLRAMKEARAAAGLEEPVAQPSNWDSLTIKKYFRRLLEAYAKTAPAERAKFFGLRITGLRKGVAEFEIPVDKLQTRKQRELALSRILRILWKKEGIRRTSLAKDWIQPVESRLDSDDRGTWRRVVVKVVEQPLPASSGTAPESPPAAGLEALGQAQKAARLERESVVTQVSKVMKALVGMERELERIESDLVEGRSIEGRYGIWEGSDLIVSLQELKDDERTLQSHLGLLESLQDGDAERGEEVILQARRDAQRISKWVNDQKVKKPHQAVLTTAAGLEEWRTSDFVRWIKDFPNPAQLAPALHQELNLRKSWFMAFIELANDQPTWLTLHPFARRDLLHVVGGRFAYPRNKQKLWPIFLREAQAVQNSTLEIRLNALLGLAYLADTKEEQREVFDLTKRALTDRRLDSRLLDKIIWISATLATPSAIELLEKLIQADDFLPEVSRVKSGRLGKEGNRILHFYWRQEPWKGPWHFKSTGKGKLPVFLNDKAKERFEAGIARHPAVLREFRKYPQAWQKLAGQYPERHPFYRAVQGGLAPQAGLEGQKVQRRVQFRNEIHTRPANEFSAWIAHFFYAATRRMMTLTLRNETRGGKEVKQPEWPMDILALGIDKGHTVTIEIEGVDQTVPLVALNQAADAVQYLLEQIGKGKTGRDGHWVPDADSLLKLKIEFPKKLKAIEEMLPPVQKTSSAGLERGVSKSLDRLEEILKQPGKIEGKQLGLLVKEIRENFRQTPLFSLVHYPHWPHRQLKYLWFSPDFRRFLDLILRVVTVVPDTREFSGKGELQSLAWLQLDNVVEDEDQASHLYDAGTGPRLNRKEANALMQEAIAERVLTNLTQIKFPTQKDRLKTGKGIILRPLKKGLGELLAYHRTAGDRELAYSIFWKTKGPSRKAGLLTFGDRHWTFSPLADFSRNTLHTHPFGEMELTASQEDTSNAIKLAERGIGSYILRFDPRTEKAELLRLNPATFRWDIESDQHKITAELISAGFFAAGSKKSLKEVAPAAGLEGAPEGTFDVWIGSWLKGEGDWINWAVFPTVYPAEETEDNTGAKQMGFAIDEWSRRKGVTLEGVDAVDFGVGSGPLTGYLLAHGANEVVGIDVNPAAIDNTRYNLHRHLPETVGRFRGFVGDGWGALPDEERKRISQRKHRRVVVFNAPAWNRELSPDRLEAWSESAGGGFSTIVGFLKGLLSLLEDPSDVAFLRIYRFDGDGTYFNPTELGRSIEDEHLPLRVELIRQSGSFVVAVLTRIEPSPAAGLEEASVRQAASPAVQTTEMTDEELHQLLIQNHGVVTMNGKTYVLLDEDIELPVERTLFDQLKLGFVLLPAGLKRIGLPKEPVPSEGHQWLVDLIGSDDVVMLDADTVGPDQVRFWKSKGATAWATIRITSSTFYEFISGDPKRINALIWAAHQAQGQGQSLTVQEADTQYRRGYRVAVLAAA